MSGVSTHVLDTVTGLPASGIAVTLERVDGDGQAAPGTAGAIVLGRGRTDADGRVRDLFAGTLPAGTYRLIFATGPYHQALAPGEPPFFPEVTVTFLADGTRPGYHVPLLLSPYSYATYRGS